MKERIMPTLLHLDGSARRGSFSRELGRVFAEEWQLAHPDGKYIYRDLGSQPAPFLDEARAEIAEYAAIHGIRDVVRMGEAARTTEQRASWALTRLLLEELLLADGLLLATPMYNFSIPASVKAWIDQVTFPGLSLAGKFVVVTTARGGSYASGTPRAHYDFQEPYLRAYFTQLGVADLSFIHTEWTRSLVSPMLSGFRDRHVVSWEAALEQARRLARRACKEGAHSCSQDTADVRP